MLTTVSFTAFDVTLPAALVTTHRKSRPLRAELAVMDIVAALLVKLGVFHVFPPSAEYCH